jgi:uncharacterized protein (TIGR02680 family)
MSDKLVSEPSRNGAPARPLPRPARERWQPLRSGVLNIFKFDEEEFLFEDGRLLLRGNNGAGKSRVLALQLPFLLDGEMASHRVEPDADPAKRMEWNLLMNKYENRLGYTWIEFGRRDTDRRQHYLTLGCGMHARKGTGIPPTARWFFVTTKRVGEGLSLISENRVPLNRERLEAVLGQGSVYRSAREYRIAVDEALFGLGARYEPLIELLLQLRKPQIMRDFKADDLSRLLSEALPPLSPRLIENVSVSFRSLETDRQQLADLAETCSSVETFLKSYQHYVRVAVRRRATDVRLTHSRFENAQRELRRLAARRDENLEALTTAEVIEGRVKEQLAATREAERTLLASPEMKNAEDLRQAVETRDERARQAQDAVALAEQAADVHQRFRKEREAADALTARTSRNAGVAHAALKTAWESTSMPAEGLPPPELAATEDVLAARKAYEKAVTERVRQIALLHERNAALAVCVGVREREETRFEQRREDVARCEEEEMRLRAERAQVLTEIVRRIYEWEATLEVLPLVKGEDWQFLLDAWSPGEVVPLVQRIEPAHADAAQALADKRSRCARSLEDQAATREETVAALKSLLAGAQSEPAVPHTRAEGFRLTRPGAPLWKLCEFRDEVSTQARSGFEAGLEAAGLLDAWVTPTGELIDATTHDVFFQAVVGVPDAGLNRVLRVEIDPADAAASAIAPQLVQGILGCIGSVEEEGETWIADNGRWRHGLLRGAWSKPQSEFLGHAARENARHRRISALESTLAEIDETIAQIERERDSITARISRLQAERDRAPTIEPLQRASHALESAGSASLAARNRFEEADRALAKARESERIARDTRDRDAADIGLSAWKEPTALHQLEGLLADLREKAAALWPAWDALLNAMAAVTAATGREEDARDSFENASVRAQEAQQLAAASAAHFDTLRATVGATTDQVLARLGEVRGKLQNLVEAEDEARTAVQDLRVKQAVIEGDERRAEEDRCIHEKARENATGRLQLFAEKRLLEEAGGDLQPERVDLAPNPAVELARRIEQVLENVAADDDAWKRVQSGIQLQFSDLNDQLGMRGYHPQAEIVDEGVFAITCAFHGQTRTMTALRLALADEMQHRQEMFTAKEREVIENHLIGEVATELQTLIRAGEDWVRIVNDELDQRPASSGIKLRFVWEVDPEASDGLDAARRQLLKMTAAWSPAERDSIGRFLQNRIKGERAADEAASLEDHLRHALDYRSWHRFAILRFQDGQWKKLTKQTYGTGSGGEKALTLTLPQFAAAAAHYRSAAPHAPRLILLDEVFIGIDKPTRARLMGLLHNFDLDFVMTSELEWGCYATLPALGICQFASSPDSPAVLVTRLTWNGRELLPHRDGNGA